MKRAAIWVATAVLAVILTGCGKGYKVADVPNTVAVVNGQSIFASQYLDTVSRRAGNEILANLIEKAIVLKWAKDEGVMPTQDQIDKQIEILKREGVYDRQVELLGKGQVKSELTDMQARINIAKKLIKISDKEIESTYNMMKVRYVHGPRKCVELIINSDKKKVEDAAKKIKSGESFEDANAKYSDQGFSMEGRPFEIWITEGQTGLPKEIIETADKTKVGEVSKVFSFGQAVPTRYAIMKVTKVQPKVDMKLEDVKGEVEDYAALQKYQTDLKLMGEFNKKKKEAKITIDIPYLKGVANAVNNPPEPSQMMPPPVPNPAPKNAKPAK